MKLALVYFAWVRERIGTASETVDVPDGVRTIGDLITWLKKRDETYAYAFERGEFIRAAIDQVHVKHDHPLEGAREVAFFPPMTGG